MRPVLTLRGTGARSGGCSRQGARPNSATPERADAGACDGLPSSRAPFTRFPTIDVDEELRVAGWKRADLQRATGANRSTVYRWCAERRAPQYALTIILQQQTIRELRAASTFLSPRKPG